MGSKRRPCSLSHALHNDIDREAGIKMVVAWEAVSDEPSVLSLGRL